MIELVTKKTIVGILVLLVGSSLLGGVFAPWMNAQYQPKPNPCGHLYDIFYDGYITTTNGTTTITRADHIVHFDHEKNTIYTINQQDQHVKYENVTSYSLNVEMVATATICT